MADNDEVKNLYKMPTLIICTPERHLIPNALQACQIALMLA